MRGWHYFVILPGGHADYPIGLSEIRQLVSALY
jgi:hypothetical protein